MKIGICASCGQPYDAEEINDGYCLLCQPDAGVVLSMEEIMEKDLGDDENEQSD